MQLILPQHSTSNSVRTKLELVELVFDFKNVPDLTNLVIIGAQHILPSTLTMLESFFDRGLSPDNVFLIGKCYSTDFHAYSELRNLGVHVCPSSLKFDKSSSFDSVYNANIRTFVEKTIRSIRKIKDQQIVVLDDGGVLISRLNEICLKNEMNLTCLEQTTSGYEKIKNLNLQMCVVNVARSFTKLHVESKIIAKTAIQAVYEKFSKGLRLPKNILVIGNGAIGGALADALEGQFDIFLADTSRERSEVPYEEYLANLHYFDMIVGCVGKVVLSSNEISKLKSGAILSSLSSSDREFDILEFRKEAKSLSSCHDDFECCNGVKVLNCGFPINFNGNAAQVDIDEFELTRALISAGILQAIEHSTEKGLFSLEQEIQMKLIERFFKKYKFDFYE